MGIIGRVVFVFFLFLLIDFYFFQSFKTLQTGWSLERKMWIQRIYVGLSVILFLGSITAFVLFHYQVVSRSTVMIFSNIAFIVFAAKLIGILPLLLEDVTRLVKWIILMLQPKAQTQQTVDTLSRATFISYTSLALAGTAMSAFVYGMAKTAYDFTVRKYRIPLAKLPDAFNGLRIVQISDIHSGSFLSAEPIHKAIDQILALQPDVIFFTGDLVNDRSSEIASYVEAFARLKAPLGVYSILGNHDYGDYVLWPDMQSKQENLKQLFESHKAMGWDLLRNEHRMLERKGEKIKLLGVENWGSALRFPKYGDINKAKSGSEDAPVTLLLSHDPSHWEAQVLTEHNDIDITFSGHTHGFQFGVEIPGFKWSPSQYVYKQWAGLYNQGNQYINVNRGFGFIGYLGRVGIKPEITLVELVNA